MITTNITIIVITTIAKMAPITPPAIAPAEPPPSSPLLVSVLPSPGAVHYTIFS